MEITELLNVNIVHKETVLAGVMEIADGLSQQQLQLLTQQHRVSSLDLQVLDY